MAFKKQRMVKQDKDLIEDLVKISKYFGQRFDLIQAAGGNSSIKINKRMFIKSSGYSLSEVELKNGYSVLRNDKLTNFLYKIKNYIVNSRIEKKSFHILKDSIIKGDNPSIETFSHSILKKFTIHLHPIASNIISVNRESKIFFNQIFSKEISDGIIFYIKYRTPGIALATEITNHLLPYDEKIKMNKSVVLFLENHGLICSSDDKKELIKSVERIMKKFENFLNIDLKRYKFTTKISKVLWEQNYKNLVSYYSEDLILNNFLKSKNLDKTLKPLNPDGLLYCGESPLIVRGPLEKNILSYIKKFHTYPRVVITGKNIYFVAPNVLKAREIEDVFKSHLYFDHYGETKRPLLKKHIKKLDSYNPQKNRLRFWFDYDK